MAGWTSTDKGGHFGRISDFDDEFISLNTFMIQKLMKRVDELENEIQKMKGAQHGDSIS